MLAFDPPTWEDLAQGARPPPAKPEDMAWMATCGSFEGGVSTQGGVVHSHGAEPQSASDLTRIPPKCSALCCGDVSSSNCFFRCTLDARHDLRGSSGEASHPGPPRQGFRRAVEQFLVRRRTIGATLEWQERQAKVCAEGSQGGDRSSRRTQGGIHVANIRSQFHFLSEVPSECLFKPSSEGMKFPELRIAR